jgi:D-3-phosphoglycerate dehydrogenase
MGIISFGKIGQAIAERARCFGVRVIAYDPYLPEAFFRTRGVEPAPKGELLSRSHAVMMQVPMTAETRHFLGAAEFARMRPGAIVVNTGRGPTIDNKALYDALASGHLAGAGLDDLEEEPAKRATWNPRDNPLFRLPNVIVTPHSAYYSEESIRIARETAAREVARVLIGEPPNNPVNTLPVATAS